MSSSVIDVFIKIALQLEVKAKHEKVESRNA